MANNCLPKFILKPLQSHNDTHSELNFKLIPGQEPCWVMLYAYLFVVIKKEKEKLKHRKYSSFMPERIKMVMM